jgi:hypothetical protein
MLTEKAASGTFSESPLPFASGDRRIGTPAHRRGKGLYPASFAEHLSTLVFILWCSLRQCEVATECLALPLPK